MGRITEEASATITMNMEPARKRLNELGELIEADRKELEKLMAVTEDKRDNAAIDDLNSKLKKYEKEQKRLNEQLKTFREY